ncbi:carbamoyltransferase HypF [Candidatus Marinarcus aquaticus]|uniref:Carbamoyltransferase n=1 Tax=Candidatus Marinarcus aquaticus TaxID=2044504 RepID=A0A4Q0XY10_9BACT|nr:carbamoyltransferase HypF [Candidatus Marinarcus aquaticus]RXJ60841.1 carbamoyltransferase HypF [Candidatus Marinarcus aquaticus]
MITKKITVHGVVQGVGFRPYVYQLATQHNLYGWVNNDDQGVNIVLTTTPEKHETFLYALQENPPPLSKISNITIHELALESFSNFQILHSHESGSKSTLISADIGICEACIEDIQNTQDRRYKYAFTNCTNCGPRYTIIKTVPYDRAHTSMKNFTMCKECKTEYEDPMNRRYHAQPICCPNCGPTITLYDNKNSEIAQGKKALEKVTQSLQLGDIVAIKGLGGFHLVCDATSNYAVKKLRQRKNRPSKPFAVMCKDSVQAQSIALMNEEEHRVLNSKEKPIVLLHKEKINMLADAVAPNIDRIGLFLPYTPLHLLLFEHFDKPIVATSANLSDEPIIRKKDELMRKLGFVADYVLDFDREIINACDDSVVQVCNNQLFKLRNARGYAPTAITHKKEKPKAILAIGANQKNSIALALDKDILLSPHIGDLNSIEAMEYFDRTVETFCRFYDFKPELIVCDKHPNYETTKWAKSQEIPVVQIQHHYAHVLSCMAEYGLDEKVLAFAFDGTGYGDDGNIWGGEVFIASKKEYIRIKHFKYFKLLGGEIAIKQIKRLGLSLLFDNYTLEELVCMDNPTLKAFSSKEIELLHTVWNNGLNAALTSSVGRLFDAVCSLAGIEQHVSYEGEAGLLIEQAYDASSKEYFEFDISHNEIDIHKAIQAMVKERSAQVICTKFINMLVEVIITISQKNSTLPVVLTGGVFQNKTLLEAVTKRLDELQRQYYYSKEVPLNDAGIAVGQLYSQL